VVFGTLSIQSACRIFRAYSQVSPVHERRRPSAQVALHLILHREVDKAAFGPIWPRDARVASVVANALLFGEIKWNWTVSFTMWTATRSAPAWQRIPRLALVERAAGRRKRLAKAPAPQLAQTLTKFTSSRSLAESRLSSSRDPLVRTLFCFPATRLFKPAN
jgi:hypothetical protein